MASRKQGFAGDADIHRNGYVRLELADAAGRWYAVRAGHDGNAIGGISGWCDLPDEWHLRNYRANLGKEQLRVSHPRLQLISDNGIHQHHRHMGHAMTRLTFIAVALLCLCGIATAQNQQSWGSMGLMRAGVGAVSLGTPDPNEDLMVLLWDFEDYSGNPVTNVALWLVDSSGNNVSNRLTSLSQCPVVGTNANGTSNRAAHDVGSSFTSYSTNAFLSSISRFGTSITISFWTRTVGTNLPNVGFAFYNNATVSYSKRIESLASNMRFFSTSAGASDASVSVPLSTGNEWVCYSMTSTTNDLKAYTNGILVGQDSSVSACSTSVFDYIRVQALSSSSYTSLIDRVVMYGKALSSQEVAAVVQNTNPSKKNWRK
jgi:hypothetical protein